MIKKYRKKAIIIEAIQWDGSLERGEEIISAFENVQLFDEKRKKMGMFIDTLEGMMTVSPGDYVIRGIRGEVYPCKPDIFEDSYELVE